MLTAVYQAGGVILAVLAIAYVFTRAVQHPELFGRDAREQRRANRTAHRSAHRHGHRIYLAGRLGWIRWLWW